MKPRDLIIRLIIVLVLLAGAIATGSWIFYAIAFLVLVMTVAGIALDELRSRHK